jgi:hypothetical protein
MVNMGEDIVSVWLQDVHEHFVRSNIVVRKKQRILKGKKRGGGRGKEIDFLSTDGKNYYWIEVSCSLRPFLPPKKTRAKLILNLAKKKFDKEKKDAIQILIKQKKIDQWFVYSPKLFTKIEDEKSYCNALLKENIKAISFDLVLNETCKKLNYVGYDTPRQYLNLLTLLRDPKRTLSPSR